MRVKPKEKYGKLIHNVEVEGKHYQIRERRTYKGQIKKASSKLITGSELVLCKPNKELIKSGFSSVNDIAKYIVEKIEGIKEYNINFNGNLS